MKKTVCAALAAVATCLLSSCGGSADAPDPGATVQSAMRQVDGSPPAALVMALGAASRPLALPASPYSGVAPADAADQLLEFAERALPQYFPPGPATRQVSCFRYRNYSNGAFLVVATDVQACAGYAEGGVYVLGGPFGGNARYLGVLSAFITPTPRAGNVFVPTAGTPASVTCWDSGDPNRCYANPYPLNGLLSTSTVFSSIATQYARIAADNASLMACKQSAPCAASALAPSALSSAMTRASSAVVRLSLPIQSFIGSGIGGSGVTYPGTCTGTVIQNEQDQATYILTAGHCLYVDAQSFYPGVSPGGYRQYGIPIYGTFGFQKATCDAPADFQAFSNSTVVATPVFSAFEQYSADNNFTGVPYGAGADVAMLRVTSLLPLGVTPIRVSSIVPRSGQTAFSLSHPRGLDKTGGVIDGGLRAATSFQYRFNASRRLVEPGSSGGALFVFDPATQEVTVRGVLSGSTRSTTGACAEAEDLIFSRSDSWSDFLGRHIGPVR